MTIDYTKSINQLVEYLNTCRDQYYNHNNSIITDKQYDDLFDKLKTLEEESGIVLANSPTRSVGYSTVSKLKKVKHKRELLSLDKSKSVSEILDFCGKNSVIFMHKMDGLTVDLTYLAGKLTIAETRGDGVTGEDITHNAKTFLGVPDTIPYQDEIHITGEAIISYKDFAYINSQLPEAEKYANPRNLASGSVRQLDSSICASRKVKFITWNANDISSDGTMSSGLDNADKIGFITVYRRNRPDDKNMNEQFLTEMFDAMKGKAQSLDYPIDGIVVMFDNIEYGNSLGKTSHHFKNGIAFKFYDETVETKLRNIEWGIGKKGTLTPVAIFDPIPIDGSTVSRASLSNVSILKEKLNIAFEGQALNVSKRNAIIPCIESADTSGITLGSRVFDIPEKCPYCGGDTEIIAGDAFGRKYLFCKNRKACNGVILEKLSAFVSRSAMDIDGLSSKTLEKVIELGWVKSYSDIYLELPKHFAELNEMQGFGERSVTLLKDSIEKSKHTTLTRLLTAMNIDNVGKQNAATLSQLVKRDANRLIELSSGELQRLMTLVDGFGDVIVQSVNDWINSDDFEEFKKLVKIMDFESDASVVQTMDGVKVVITGKLNQFANRDEFVKFVEDHGGKVQSSVTKETAYLVNNDISSTSGKIKKALELNIPIISESDFMNLFNGKEKKSEKKGGLF